MSDIPQSRSEFEDALRELTRSYESRVDNPGSHEVSDSTRCFGCMFIDGCRDCFDCTHCTDCIECRSCTQCTDCEDCYDCAHCVACDRCAGSSHLIQCTRCVDSEFCFGCVGLVDAEFCILNDSYTREEYFERREQLRAMFGP